MAYFFGPPCILYIKQLYIVIDRNDESFKPVNVRHFNSSNVSQANLSSDVGRVSVQNCLVHRCLPFRVSTTAPKCNREREAGGLDSRSRGAPLSMACSSCFVIHACVVQNPMCLFSSLGKHLSEIAMLLRVRLNRSGVVFVVFLAKEWKTRALHMYSLVAGLTLAIDIV